MNKERGIVYILTNPYHKEDVIKIGSTKNIIERMNVLGRGTGVPCPFECYVAYELDNYKEVEKIMHTFYRSVEKHIDKKHKNKEFYLISPSCVDDVLSQIAQLMNGKKIIVDNSEIYNSEQLKVLEKKQIGKRFKFADYNISEGSQLIFTKDNSEKCVVIANNKVLYKNNEYSLSRLTGMLMKKLGYSGTQYNGYCYWEYNDCVLNDMNKPLQSCVL